MKLFGLGDDFYRTTKLLWDLRLGETAVFVLRRRTFAATRRPLASVLVERARLGAQGRRLA